MRRLHVSPAPRDHTRGTWSPTRAHDGTISPLRSTGTHYVSKYHLIHWWLRNKCVEFYEKYKITAWESFLCVIYEKILKISPNYLWPKSVRITTERPTMKEGLTLKFEMKNIILKNLWEYWQSSLIPCMNFESKINIFCENTGSRVLFIVWILVKWRYKSGGLLFGTSVSSLISVPSFKLF